MGLGSLHRDGFPTSQECPCVFTENTSDPHDIVLAAFTSYNIATEKELHHYVEFDEAKGYRPLRIFFSRERIQSDYSKSDYRTYLDEHFDMLITPHLHAHYVMPFFQPTVTQLIEPSKPSRQQKRKAPAATHLQPLTDRTGPTGFTAVSHCVKVWFKALFLDNLAPRSCHITFRLILCGVVLIGKGSTHACLGKIPYHFESRQVYINKYIYVYIYIDALCVVWWLVTFHKSVSSLCSVHARCNFTTHQPMDVPRQPDAELVKAAKASW